MCRTYGCNAIVYRNAVTVREMVFSFFRSANKSSIKEPSAGSMTDVQNALSMSQKAINDLSTRHKQLEDRIKECVVEAKKKHSNNDKPGALAALRRKKLYEEEATRIASSIMTLETQNITLEGAQMQQLALSALSTGVAAHKTLQEHMDPSKVDMLMDQLEEQREAQLEIFDAMTQGVSLPSEFEDELEALMQEEKAKEEAAEESVEKSLEEIAAQPHEAPAAHVAESVPIAQ